MTVTAILQARMSSTRLPGKVMADLCGAPMLVRQIERIRRAADIDTLVIATSFEMDDDPVAELAGDIGVACVRGSLSDVLDRFIKAAHSFPADHFMRLTGDCPLADPALLDDLIAFHIDGSYDYSSNTLLRSYPHGLDAEIMRADVLKTAWREAHSDHDREHVTPFLYRTPGPFVLGSMRQQADQSELRWTVDFPEDLEFVRAVFAALYPNDPAFTRRDVLELLDRQPDIAAINRARSTLPPTKKVVGL